jgi:hypothetical protein
LSPATIKPLLLSVGSVAQASFEALKLQALVISSSWFHDENSFVMEPDFRKSYQLIWNLDDNGKIAS